MKTGDGTGSPRTLDAGAGGKMEGKKKKKKKSQLNLQKQSAGHGCYREVEVLQYHGHKAELAHSSYLRAEPDYLYSPTYAKLTGIVQRYETGIDFLI